MRLTVVWLKPDFWAMDRVLQWVASLGVVSNVNAITRSTSASSIIRGRPLRGWSNRPSSPCSKNRERHFPTVSTHTRKSVATLVLLWPSAEDRTILARRASAWAVLGRRGPLFQGFPFGAVQGQRRDWSALPHIHPPLRLVLGRIYHSRNICY